MISIDPTQRRVVQALGRWPAGQTFRCLMQQRRYQCQDRRSIRTVDATTAAPAPHPQHRRTHTHQHRKRHTKWTLARSRRLSTVSCRRSHH